MFPRPRNTIKISTHSAREDGDLYDAITDDMGEGFQPTPPARTETKQRNTTDTLLIFQPTPPARTETQSLGCFQSCSRFQPTPPARTETVNLGCWDRYNQFQPTPPARTETRTRTRIRTAKSDFNPLRPRGRRLNENHVGMEIWTFQPTPPARTETAILHKKTNNSSSHFHNQITSYSLKSPPTCPAHIQNRSHCAVFPVRIPP